MQIFSERLKTARDYRRLTQSELGRITKLPTSSIGKFETCSRMPSLQSLTSLVQALDVTADYLLGITDMPVANTAKGNLLEAVNTLPKYDIEIIEGLIKLLVDRNANRCLSDANKNP